MAQARGTLRFIHETDRAFIGSMLNSLASLLPSIQHGETTRHYATLFVEHETHTILAFGHEEWRQIIETIKSRKHPDKTKHLVGAIRHLLDQPRQDT